MEQRTIDLPAGRVHYGESGPADGQPIVFVHGFLVDATLWSDVPERLGEQGFRTLAPTWPLGSHTTPMNASADLSPRTLAHIVLSFLRSLDLREVILVGSDTGGAICQFVLDEDDSRVGRLVLTNCDAFEAFPPFPFNWLFRLGRHPRVARAVLGATRIAAVRNSKLGFGWLVRRKLTAEESRPWVTPYLADAGVRRDVAAFLKAWRAEELADVATRLPEFDRPVLLCWAPKDPFFKIGLGRRLAATFPDARLVEFPDALTFVSLDQPARLAEEIGRFARS